MSDQDKIPTPRTDKRDGNWLDSFGCCKVCDGEIPHGHTPNCDIYKLEQKVTTTERELATVTKEKDRFNTELETIMRFIREAVDSEALDGCAPAESVALVISQRDNAYNERDSLRAEVENLKIWIDHTGFFCAGTDCHSVSDRALELLRGWKRNCMAAQSEPSHIYPVAAPSAVQQLWDSDSCPKCRQPMEVCSCGEPSQVGGKESPKRHLLQNGIMQEHECGAWIRWESFAAAQATIAELQKELIGEREHVQIYVERLDRKLWEEWYKKGSPPAGWRCLVYNAISIVKSERNQLRSENAALRVERDASDDFMVFMTIALREYECECGKHTAESTPPMMWPKLIACIIKKATSDLRAQLATAIAERNEAVNVREGWRSKWNEVQQRETKNYKRLVAERDSALAACAAKDVALRVAHECINQYSNEDQSGRMTHYYAESKLPIIAAALSPIAGSDYVPKDAFNAVASACQRIVDHWNSDDDDRLKPCADDVTACENALATAAPFLTDSTGEEGK